MTKRTDQATETAPTYPSRRAAPSTTFEYNDRLHGAVVLSSDGDGLVRITSKAESDVADALGLTVEQEG